MLILGLVIGLLMGGVAGFVGARLLDGGADVTFGPPVSRVTSVPSQPSERGTPVPLGTDVDLGNGWHLKVISFDPAPEMGDQKAPDGRTWVSVGLVATYTGGEEEADSPFFGMDIEIVGDSGVAARRSDAACFAPDPEFDNLADVYSGGSVEGNFCLAVPAGDVGTAVLVARPSMAMDSTRTYFALR